MTDTMHQIGEVADTVGLSLRTIRYYDEVGIVVPSGRSPGGYRLYTDTDIERLAFVKDLKPLDFSLDEIRDLLATIDALESPKTANAHTTERLALFAALGEQRCEDLRAQLRAAERIVDALRSRKAARRRTAQR
ncbi:MAG: MerR family transcriptional regulator [Acidimicrobiia bacterium]